MWTQTWQASTSTIAEAPSDNSFIRCAFLRPLGPTLDPGLATAQKSSDETTQQGPTLDRDRLGMIRHAGGRLVGTSAYERTRGSGHYRPKARWPIWSSRMRISAHTTLTPQSSLIRSRTLLHAAQLRAPVAVQSESRGPQVPARGLGGFGHEPEITSHVTEGPTEGQGSLQP